MTRDDNWRDVTVSVGAVYTFFEGGRKVPLIPIVEAEVQRDEELSVPRYLKIAYRDHEDSAEEGRRRHIWVYDPTDPDNPRYAFLTVRMEPQHRDLFERLRGLWGFWVLRVRLGTNRTDYQVPCGGNGKVFRLARGIDGIISSFDRIERAQYVESVHRGLLREWAKRTPVARADSPPLIYPRQPKTRREFSRDVLEATNRVADAAEKIGGSMPWRIDWRRLDEEVRRFTHAEIVRQYLLAIQQAWRCAQGGEHVTFVGRTGQPLATAEEESKRVSTLVWAGLRNARIFELTADSYVALAAIADRYTTEKLAGIRHAEHYTSEQRRTIQQRVQEAGQHVPLPENLPFEACYLAWGAGVGLSDSVLRLYGTPDETVDAMNRTGQGGSLVGTLVQADGTVTDILHLGGYGMAFAQQREEGFWTNPMNLTPWIVTAALAGINEHQALVVEGARRWEDQKIFKQAAKTDDSGVRRPIPPPYYTVYMRDQQIKESARREFRRHRDVEWSHRWDVRGHEVARIQRGKLPIDPKLERQLTKRHYRIFTLDRPDAEAYRVLMARGQPPPKLDEWVAVLASWRQPFVKGPAAAPYIPSVHKPTRGMIARKGKPSG